MKKSNSIKKFFKREVDLLKNIELNELDFKESGEWPILIKIIFMAITFAVIIFLGNNVHIKNLESRYSTEVTKENTLLNDIQKYSYVVPTIADYENQLVGLKVELEIIKQKLPEKIEMSSILDDLTQLAVDSGVVTESINLENEKIQENYIDLPFKINAKGKFHNFAAFLSELAKMNRIVTVHSVVITPSQEKDSSLLEMQFVAKTYKYYTPNENIEKDKK
jgi:type IV pilus assembly protein PilO